MCPLSSMKNPSCSYKTSEPGKYFLDLQFTVDNYNSEQEIQEADTFIQFNRVNKTSTCKLVYNGPKWIKLNTKTKQICVMDTFDPQNIELEIDADTCRAMKPTTHQWASDGCFETAAFPPKPPQIKVVNDDFHIYCPGNNITMFNHTNACEQRVHIIPQSEPFGINGVQFKVNNYQFKKKQTVSRWTKEINWIISAQRDIIELKTPNTLALKALLNTLNNQTENTSIFDFEAIGNYFSGLWDSFKSIFQYIGYFWEFIGTYILYSIFGFFFTIILFLQCLNLCKPKQPIVYAVTSIAPEVKKERLTILKDDNHKKKKKKEKTSSRISTPDYTPLNQICYHY